MTKSDICNRIIEAMEIYKPSNHRTGWADDINLDTAERVIMVMQNIVRGVRDERTKRREKALWIDTAEKEEWYAEQYKCNQCGEMMLGKSKFCPECGARMMNAEE